MYTEITLVLVYFLSVIGPENTRHSLNQSAEKTTSNRDLVIPVLPRF